MQTPDGKLISPEGLKKILEAGITAAEELSKRMEQETGKPHPVFSVGEHLVLRGGKFRVHAIRRNRLILKPIWSRRAMNHESLSDCTCDACGTRIEWEKIPTDAGRYPYHRYGVCQCEEREWYTHEYGSQPQRWTHPVWTRTRRAKKRRNAMNPMTQKIVVQPPVYDGVRLTAAARELLVRAGNWVRLTQADVPLYDITLLAPPVGLVLVLIGEGDEQHRGLRLSDEQAYPGEWPDGGIAWPERGSWTPCPRCGAALRWHEAGYVPGYRVCMNGHAAILSGDGRVASPIEGGVTL